MIKVIKAKSSKKLSVQKQEIPLFKKGKKKGEKAEEGEKPSIPSSSKRRRPKKMNKSD